MPRPHIEVVLAAHVVPEGLREAVRQTGASASFRPFPEVLRRGLSTAADAVVIVVPEDMRELNRPLRVLFDRLADEPRATLVLKPGGGLVPKLAHPQVVPITFGCGTGAAELSARLATMVEMRASLRSLHQGMLANRRSEESATRRFTNQLRLASQVQRELIPETLPTIGPVSFSAVFRPVDFVSGDIYDVHRLDEAHLAIALADATGHGIPAALLTVFIKRALRGKEIENGHYRILRPDEVLARLNEDLLDADFSDCAFVAATYGVLNVETLELSLARGGSPYPILRRADGTLEFLRPPGGVLGVTPDATFACDTVQLQPGDELLICSDGLEKVVLPQMPVRGLAEVFARAATAVAGQAAVEQPSEDTVADLFGDGVSGGEDPEPALALAGVASAPGGNGNGNGHRLASAKCRAKAPGPSTGQPCHPHALTPERALLASDWCNTLRESGVQAALNHLSMRYDMLRRMGHPLDDLTALALRVRA